MIRRRFEGNYLLVTRAHHARVAALIGENLGGALRAPHEVPSFAAALRVQGAGFADYEANLPLDAAGRPLSFDDFPLLTLLHAWESATVAAARFSPYAGLLASVMTLQRSAVVALHARTPRETFEINRLQHREIELQEQLRTALGMRNDIPLRAGLPEPGVELTPAEAELVYDHRLMVMIKQLATELCARRSVNGHLVAAPTAPNGPKLAIAFRWSAADHFTLHPFCLRQELQMSISGLYVKDRAYDHESELHHALAKAPQRHLHVRITPPQSA